MVSALISAASTAMQRQIPQHPAARGSLLATSLCSMALPGLPDGCAHLQQAPAGSLQGFHTSEGSSLGDEHARHSSSPQLLAHWPAAPAPARPGKPRRGASTFQLEM